MRRAIVLLGIAVSISFVPGNSANHITTAKPNSRTVSASTSVDPPEQHGGNGGFEWG